MRPVSPKCPKQLRFGNYPIGSTYGIFTYIYHVCHNNYLNVGIYSLHDLGNHRTICPEEWKSLGLKRFTKRCFVFPSSLSNRIHVCYIYLHCYIKVNQMIPNVGKYTSLMDCIGYVILTSPWGSIENRILLGPQGATKGDFEHSISSDLPGACHVCWWSLPSEWNGETQEMYSMEFV